MQEIKPKKTEIINKKTLLVTVDVGKVTNMGYYRCPDGTEVKPFEFFNTGQGFNKFWMSINTASNKYDLNNIIVGFESTGPYAEPLVNYLSKREVKFVQVNPMHTKRLKELQGNSPNKTDKKDPKVIADIIELGHALSLVVPEGASAHLRRLIHARERRIEMRTELFNQLESLMAVVFPEFSQVMKDMMSKSVQHLLSVYGSPESIAELGCEKLTEILKRISRGKLGKERAEKLYEAAKTSIGIHEGRDSMIFEIKNILNAIESFNNFIKDLEIKIRHFLKEIPYSKYILSIKGIGEITAAGLIGEVGDFQKFKTIPEVHKLAGFDLFEISSGKHKGQRRISKRGRPLMRKIMYFAALNVIRKGGIMHEQYQIFVNRGMLKMKALIAIARKLLGVIFALVRDHSQYVTSYTKMNSSLTMQLV